MLDNNRLAYHSSLTTGDAAVNQVFHDNQLSFSNEFNLVRSLRSHDVIQTYSYISHSAEPEKRTIGPDYR